MLPTYEAKPGTLVYYETVRDGLLPCRLVTYTIVPYANREPRDLAFEWTRDTLLGKRGEIYRSSPLHVIPRNRVRRRKYSTRILPYQWVQPPAGESAMYA